VSTTTVEFRTSGNYGVIEPKECEAIRMVLGVNVKFTIHIVWYYYHIVNLFYKWNYFVLEPFAPFYCSGSITPSIYGFIVI